MWASTLPLLHRSCGYQGLTNYRNLDLVAPGQLCRVCSTFWASMPAPEISLLSFGSNPSGIGRGKKSHHDHLFHHHPLWLNQSPSGRPSSELQPYSRH
ncbi:hypothetical protein LIA77_02756 [Sarocladium implicatum]|nr:hypothetical protein LIA77_02756 [Sarocladium implicatum]